MSDNRVALVIGGGSGIGADAAKALHECGYAIGVMSSSGKGETLANDLGGFGFTGSNLVNDDLKGFIDGAVSRFGRIDAVVNLIGRYRNSVLGCQLKRQFVLLQRQECVEQ